MSFREEMIQVAAVAVAIVEDLDYGAAGIDQDRQLGQVSNGYAVAMEVLNERENQDQKWGPQTHDPEVWLAILMEEVGEAARARLEDMELA